MTNESTWAYKDQILESVEQFTLLTIISQRGNDYLLSPGEKKVEKEPNQTKKERKQENRLKSTNSHFMLSSWQFNQLPGVPFQSL
jgi:hypothetical protein